VLQMLQQVHADRKLPCCELRTSRGGDTPLHVAVRALRISELTWMVESGGYAPGLVLKNAEGRVPTALLEAAEKHLRKAVKAAKRAARLAKAKAKAEAKAAAAAAAGSTKYMVAPAAGGKPLAPAGGPGGAPAAAADAKPKKGKKSKKVPPPPPFTLGLEEAQRRLDGKGTAFIAEAKVPLIKIYDEQAKVAAKAEAEKAKKEAERLKAAEKKGKGKR